MPFTDFMSKSGRPRSRGAVFERLKRSLKRRNREFEKLTKAEQRVRIAKDVIEQLDIGKMVPRSTYLEADIWMEDYGRELCEVTSQVQCQVCGIGALFVAAVERADDLTIREAAGTGLRASIVDYLKPWFSYEDLGLIENHFEQGGGNEKSPSPIMREPWPEKRMRMIMENIISNRGRFNPNRGAHKI